MDGYFLRRLVTLMDDGLFSGRGAGGNDGFGASQLSQTEDSLRQERIFINKINLVRGIEKCNN